MRIGLFDFHKRPAQGLNLYTLNIGTTLRQLHPDVEVDTVKLFEEANILTRHVFGDGRARYETVAPEHHDHLIDMDSGQVIEFRDDEIERLQRNAARDLGYRLVGHRLELYGVRIGGKKAKKARVPRRRGNGSPSGGQAG